MLASTNKNAACLVWDCSWLNIYTHRVMSAVMWAGAHSPEAFPRRIEPGLLGLTVSPVRLAVREPRVRSIAKAVCTTYSVGLGCASLSWHGVYWIASGASIMDWGICIAVQSSTCIQVQSFGLFYRITKHLEFSFKDVRVGYVLPSCNLGLPNFSEFDIYQFLNLEIQIQLYFSSKRVPKYGAVFRPRKRTTQKGYAQYVCCW